MKYVLIGDIHGMDLISLEKDLDSQNIDVLICTGDFDQAKTIRQFMELELRYKNNGKEVIVVPGNHDDAILNNIAIRSSAFKQQGKTAHQLYTELINDPIAYNYIDGLVNSKDLSFTTHRAKLFLDKNKYGDTYQTIVLHGAYDGNLSNYPDCSVCEMDLWMRLETRYDYEKNFNMMDKQKNRWIGLTTIRDYSDNNIKKIPDSINSDYNVMIRGHNHHSAYVYRDPIEGISDIKHYRMKLMPYWRIENM
jgi:3',5'-cyclic AMP phosphodiesterase CpdA